MGVVILVHLRHRRRRTLADRCTPYVEMKFVETMRAIDSTRRWENEPSVRSGLGVSRERRSFVVNLLGRDARATSAQLLQELADAIDPLVDLLHAGGEAQADVGVEPAVVAGDDGNVVLLEQRGGEADGIGDRHISRLLADVRADVREAV